MKTYNKDNYYKSGQISTESAECINDIIMSADGGFQPAISLLLSDIFTTLERKYTFSENKLEAMLEKTETKSGIIYYVLGTIQNQKDCDGVQQNFFRKSMNSGFILGNVGFAKFMYSKKKYATSLKHFLETLDHPQYNLLSHDVKSQIINDISLCNYNLKDYDNFWKYNKKARELKLGVAMNNAANAYMRGDGKKVNHKKALKLYKDSLEHGYDQIHYATSQIKKCNESINDTSKV